MKKVNRNLLDFREFTKRIEQIENKIHNLEKHNVGPNSTEESQSQSLTIGSGSSYKLEGENGGNAKRENKISPSRNDIKKTELITETSQMSLEPSKPKAMSDLGSITNYESKYSKQEPVGNIKYEGILRQPRYGSYRSTLIENFGSKDNREKMVADENFKSSIHSKETKEKTLGQSFSATFAT